MFIYAGMSVKLENRCCSVQYRLVQMLLRLVKLVSVQQGK